MQENLEAFVARAETFFNDTITRAPAFLIALVVFLLTLWLARRLSRLAGSVLEGRGRAPNAITVIELLTRWAIIVGGTLLALAIAVPSFDFANLISVLGIGSVAIGFAFRDIFQNFLAGIIILLTDTFQIGDQIIIPNEDLEGTVTAIDTRATTIETYDQREIIIPNAILFTNPVMVNTSTDRIRTDIEVGVAYDVDIDTASALLIEAVSRVEGVMADPGPDVLVTEFADSSVVLRARWWTDSRRSVVVRTRSKVAREIKYTLDANGIEIPFPIRTLYVRDEVGVRVAESKGATNGDVG